MEEEKPLPQLVVVDGGKGQLNAALKSLEKLNLRGKMGVIGLAKKLEEIYYPDDPLPLYLDKKSETLKVIQQLRDEAHRFGITHHRKRKQKQTISTELTGIKGIGEGLAGKLLREFRRLLRRANQPGGLEALGVPEPEPPAEEELPLFDLPLRVGGGAG